MKDGSFKDSWGKNLIAQKMGVLFSDLLCPNFFNTCI